MVLPQEADLGGLMNEEESPEEQNLRLAMALLDNDENVLGEILRLYAPNIIEVLYSKFSRRMGVLKYEDIEDAVSVALRKLWDARSTYDDGKQSIRVWLYCLADHVALDVLKHNWYKARKLEENIGQDRLLEKPDQVATVKHDPKAPESRRLAKEANDLELVVNKLSETHRKIVMADASCREDKASNEFLADELGIPAANVRVYRGRAYSTIRKEMRKLGYDIPEPTKGKP
jgi:RNA polymerase sigma factor (sigma-70 family)